MAIRWTPYPRDLAFGSHFIYPSPANDDKARALKAFLLNVKSDRYAGTPPQRMLAVAVQFIATASQDAACPYRDYFGPHVTLVPAPTHGKMLKNALFPGRSLCMEMQRLGLGKMLACIERTAAVAKSAWVAPADRPGPQEPYDSMRVDVGMDKPTDIVIVDDIVTKGATQIAAAARLSEAYPAATSIRGFAIARTGIRVDKNQDPVVGLISVSSGKARRTP